MGRAAQRRTLPKLTDRLSLGAGLSVSPVCLGLVDGPDVVEAAFDAGINFFFLTADMHWPLYEGLRAGLRRLLERVPRAEVVVCATAYVTQPDFCHMPFEEVLEAVPALGHLDVLCAGGVYARDWAPRAKVYGAHREARFCGAAAVAASFHDRATARRALADAEVDLGFVRFNAGHLGAREELFPRLGPRRRARLYAFKSVTGWVHPRRLDALGLDPASWRPSPQDHYRFALSHAALDGVLLSLSRPREVGELADALAAGPLDAEAQAYLVRLAQADKTAAAVG